MAITKYWNGVTWVATDTSATLISSEAADLDGRVSVVEAREVTYDVTPVASFIDIPINSAAKKVVIEFEANMSLFSAEMYCRPNNNTTGIYYNHERFSASTISPNTASGFTTQLAQNTGVGWRMFPNVGVGGKLSAIGTIQMQIRNTTVRRMAKCDVAQTNTIGSANHYAYDWVSTCNIGESIGNSTNITSLRFALSAGFFDSGSFTLRTIL